MTSAARCCSIPPAVPLAPLKLQNSQVQCQSTQASPQCCQKDSSRIVGRKEAQLEAQNAPEQILKHEA